MLDNLPKDVIIQILSRLPVKLLMTLMCVSRRWCSLISSPDFIATHLKHALSNPQPPLYILLHCCNKVFEKDSTLQYRSSVEERFTLHSSDERFPQIHSTDILSLLLSLDRKEDPSQFELDQEEDPSQFELDQEGDPSQFKLDQEEYPSQFELDQEGDPSQFKLDQEEYPSQFELDQEEDPSQFELDQEEDPSQSELDQEEDPSQFKLDQEEDPSQFKLFLVGSSNGLICLTNTVWDNRGIFVLWNPTIQKAISLQVPDVGSSSSSSVRYNRSLGFGYDPKTDDYKLVILYNPNTDAHFQTVPPLVEIYTLRTGAWHSGKAPGPPYSMRCFSSSVFLNGALHWPAKTWGYQGEFRNVIVSFDLEDEGFREVAMPRSLQGVKPLNVKVALVDGLLALVPFNKWGSGELHSVWVMKAYGVAESWTKLFDIDVWEEFDGGELDEVIGFTKNGEVLLTKDGRLFSYEPNTKETSYLQIGGVIESLSLDNYAESLVLLNIAQG